MALARATAVDKLNDDFTRLVKLLKGSGDKESYSLLNFADGNFKKALLLAAASYFEKRLGDHVRGLYKEFLDPDHPLASLIEKKAIARQYHTWFDWKATNANNFFSLFGDDFKTYAKSKVGSDASLELSIRNFLEIGWERNRLVHQDFASFNMEKTSSDIYDSYSSANEFVEWFPSVIREYIETMGAASSDG